PLFGTIVLASNRDGTFLLARLLANGTLDNRVNGNGKREVIIPQTDASAGTNRNQGMGKFVVAGTFNLGKFHANFALTRFNADASIDVTFGRQGNGSAVVDFGGFDTGGSLLVGQNNRLIIGGTAMVGTASSMAFAAFSSNGIPDTAFGNGGT